MKNNKFILFGIAGIVAISVITFTVSASNSKSLTGNNTGMFGQGRGGHDRMGSGGKMGLGNSDCGFGSGKNFGPGNGFGKRGGEGKGMPGMGFGGQGKRGMGFGQENTEVTKAVEAKDYNAFLTAIKGTRMEGNVTKEQFNQMVERHAKMKTINTAIEANDYNAYVQASKVSQSEFNQIVSNYKSRLAK